MQLWISPQRIRTVEYETIPITPQAEKIPKSFPCEEYVIKAQVLAGGRGKGHFDNGFKVILWFYFERVAFLLIREVCT